MKRLFALLLALLIPMAGAFAEGRYENIVDAGGGAFFAYVAGEVRTMGTPDGWGGVYEEPLLVYVGADGAEAEIGYGEIYEVLGNGIVFSYHKSTYVNAYRLFGFDGQERGEAFDSPPTFRDCAYAAVKADNGLAGIIDQSGDYVVEPVYSMAWRVSPDDFPGSEYAPFFLTAQDESITLYDCASMRTIAHYDFVDHYLWATYHNPAVFVLESWSARMVCSVQTGEILWSMKVPETEHDMLRANERILIDGFYREYVSGLPDRLVVTRGGISHLADNRGNRIPGEYQLLAPLVWNGDRGVFLIAAYDPGFEADLEDLWGKDPTPQALYGDSYRCGLIDQDGNVLAPCEFTDIKTLSITQFQLIRGGDSTILEIH